MWVPTQDEAVEMYARFLAARHGLAADRLARKTADSLQAKGDFEGYAIWARVADATERGPAKSVVNLPSRGMPSSI
ncbi:MAG: hypothetical protein WBE29_25015 [Pseudolabrys sp.]